MSFPKRTSLRRADLAKILNIYRICFAAVLKAYRAPSVTSFRRSPLGSHIWEVYLHQDTSNREEIPAEAESPVVEAYKAWNLCDHFCIFLYEALHNHLRVYGAEVSWDIVEVDPPLLLIGGAYLPQHVRHSILTVWTKLGEIFHFDCTRQQFGLPASEWLTEPFDLNKILVDVFADWENGAETRAVVRSSLLKDDNGFWGRIFSSFHTMFEELKWNMMDEMDLVLVEKLVGDKARCLAEDAGLQTWGPQAQP